VELDPGRAGGGGLPDRVSPAYRATNLASIRSRSSSVGSSVRGSNSRAADGKAPFLKVNHRWRSMAVWVSIHWLAAVSLEYPSTLEIADFFHLKWMTSSAGNRRRR
jgi:hypothetical protein